MLRARTVPPEATNALPAHTYTLQKRSFLATFQSKARKKLTPSNKKYTFICMCICARLTAADLIVSPSALHYSRYNCCFCFGTTSHKPSVQYKNEMEACGIKHLTSEFQRNGYQHH